MINEDGRDAVRRSEDGRPYIIPPEGGDEVLYDQPSALGSVLTDESNLQRWRERHILQGLLLGPELKGTKGLRPPMSNLLREIKRVEGDREMLNAIAEEAFERSGGGAGRDYGTTFHDMTELHDKGARFKGPVALPRSVESDFAAYKKLTAGMKFDAIEPFTVCDEIRHAGSPDRVSTCIGDLKSGKDIYKQQIEIAVQMAVYANSAYYDPQTGERTPMRCRRDVAYVFWIRDGVGKLVEVDVERGWLLAKLAYEVLQARDSKGLFATTHSTASARRSNVQRWLKAEILMRASSKEAIDSLWKANKRHWTDELTRFATEKIAWLDNAT